MVKVSLLNVGRGSLLAVGLDLPRPNAEEAATNVANRREMMVD
jgi:hypothetical protein